MCCEGLEVGYGVRVCGVWLWCHREAVERRLQALVAVSRLHVHCWVSWMGGVGFMRHRLDATAWDICKEFIEEKSTFMVPGDCFGFSDRIRIGYGNNIEVLEEDLDRFKNYPEKYR